MSTRRTRQVKGNNTITDQYIQSLFDSDEEVKDNLTEEQRNINKKLSDSGLLEEGLNWTEKRNLLKQLNASVTTANHEKNVRSSPKPVERIIPIDLEDDDILEKGEVAFTRKSSDLNANKHKSVFAKAFDAIKKPFTSLHSSEKTENEENAQGNSKFSDNEKLFNNSPVAKCNKLNSDIKKNDNISVDVLTSDEDSEVIFNVRKRPSPPEVERVNSVKKQKMDQTNVKLNNAHSKKLLKTEIELEKRQNGIFFNRRSIQTILNELQRSHKLRKEASAKYKFPVRWGTPIVRNSNERWDSQIIPQRLIDRYQRYLAKKGLEPPEQLHFEPPESVFKNYRNFEEAKSSTAEDSDKFDKLLEESNRPEERTTPARENGKNNGKQTYGRKGKGRNARKILDDDEEIENADDDDLEWLPKKEPKKAGEKSKPLKTAKMINYIPLNPINRAASTKSDKKENYKFFRSKNPDEVPNKIEGNEMGDKLNREGSQEIPNFGHQSTEEMDGGGDEEQVPCPICNKSFKKTLIENHATDCASKTFQD